MPMPRYAAKRDQSEPGIVSALKQAGASVWRLDTPVDLLIGIRGKTFLAEVKTGKAGLRIGQAEFSEQWRGNQIPVLRDPEQAVQWLNEVLR